MLPAERCNFLRLFELKLCLLTHLTVAIDEVALISLIGLCVPSQLG